MPALHALAAQLKIMSPRAPAWRLGSIDEIVLGGRKYSEATTTEAKEMAALGGLPVELTNAIFVYLHKKRDLYSVCRTGSPKLFAVTLPLLYRDIRLEINSVIHPKLSRIFSRDNPGLYHIRDLRVSTKSSMDDSVAAHQWLGIIMNAIPRDVLKRFSWIHPRPLSSGIVHLLWQRQSKLEHIELFPELESAARSLEQSNIDLAIYLNTHRMSSVTELRIAPDVASTAIVGSAALKEQAIKTLVIDARLWSGGEASQDLLTGVIDPLTSCLFGHLTPSELGQPGQLATLTDLRLSAVDVRFARQTWFRYLDVAQLKHLKLEYCGHADVFLANLVINVHQPSLESLLVVHNIGARADRTINKLEDLLFLPNRRLKKLHLCLRSAPELLSAAAISCHGDSLEQLLLDITGYPPGQPPIHHPQLYYIPNDLNVILSACKPDKLKELGLHLPPTSFEYEVFAKNAQWQFTRCLETIIHQPYDLRTLAVLNWPLEYDLTSATRPAYTAARVPQLARLAADIFAYFRHFNGSVLDNEDLGSRLEVVTFGLLDLSAYQPPPKYFVEATLTTIGTAQRTAGRKELKDLLEEDLHVDIMNHEPRIWDKETRARYHADGDDDQRAARESW